ncbi:Hpt domain-containing protein [Ramlibacter sp. Leaf400]|uniref:Hpt domain-containing protein n=1 Tax=Ramlibacter sp. Leaf400 TaxID=1736365 RepID=UPI0006FB9A16|nr:Hpt domain-containing protein [Ramlibacter sp. Leaf400]KQT14161.1 chemotaxis protein CheA [Ramlibacter sp. Leaf400]
MQANDNDLDLATNDLGPLAWVLDELRKSLESASAALRRFVRDAGLARGQDMASVDTGQLRIARQQLHQAVGALEMVGLGAPALILRAMEASVQKFVERPELCSEPAAAKVERAGFALTEYLEGVLLGKAASPVALFPQYKDVQELAGSDRIHPADLWPFDWRWVEAETPAVARKLVYDPALRSRMDQAVLRVVKTTDPAAGKELAECCLGLAAGQEARQPRIFWKIAAGYFEALALGLLPADLYVKRAASRVLTQYATLAKGELGVSDRLAQDLLFFCAQAVPPRVVDGPVLAGVRASYALQRFTPIDYGTPHYGRFDPVLLTQARKRITAAKESWSAASGGDVTKFKVLGEQFHLIGESLTKLHAPSAPLAQSLVATVDTVVRSAQPPRAEVAMEVATAVLYLEAAFQDLDPADSQLALRTARLAERLDGVRQGGQAEALEAWMEELYRRVSDRQTMGSVVGELRGTLGELEKLLDAFFRSPQEKGPLKNAPTHLLQMRGVLSVLGLDQAAHAVARMRETVEQILIGDFDEDAVLRASTFDKLGNNLGALGFLIDMLNYQPALVKKLFIFDDTRGELRPLMGRAEAAKPTFALPTELPSLEIAPAVELVAPAAAIAVAPQVPVAVPPAPAVAGAAPMAPAAADTGADETDDELREIFLEEAREVVGNGLAAVEALAAQPSDVAELTTLRRAFHTLKGSSRMVGLNEFGEAGWALEQVLNTWLADQKPASEDLRTVSAEALRGFGRWIEDIAAGTDAGWKSGMFRGPADVLRTEGRVLPFPFPGAAVEAATAQGGLPALEIDFGAPAAAIEPALESLDLAPQAAPEAIELSVPSFDFDLTPSEPVSAEPVALVPAQADPLADFDLVIAEAAAAQDDAEAFGNTHVIRGQAVVAEEITLDELPADFAAELGPAAPVGDLAPTTSPAEAEISAVDFDSLSALALAQAPELLPEAPEAPEAPSFDLPEFDLPPTVATATAAPEPEPEPLASDSAFVDSQMPVDDQIKVIGGLRIGIPLYNVYLNEADEWSRRLSQELAEWALELKEPLSDTAVGLAHALAGSSATVGFHALSDIARALENSLQHAQTLAWGTPQHGRAFVEAAEEIRRLLHQFAAGFLKEADPGITQSLQALEALQLPKRAELRDSGSGELEGMDFAAPVEEAPAAPLAKPASKVVHFPTLHAAAATAAPGAAAQGSRLSGDDDIDAVDAIDPDLFPIFEEEAVDLLPKLGAGLRQWAQQGVREGRDEVLRVLHTLKGSARLAGALRLGEMAHRMESAIEGLPAETPAADLEPLLQRFDDLQGAFDTLRVRASEPEAEPAPAAQPQAPVEIAPVALQQAMPQPSVQQPAPQRALLAAPVTTTLTPQRAAANQAVRVRSQLLDRLMNQAGEVMITRSRLENELRNLRGSLNDLTGNLDRLRSQLRDIELQAETQMQSRLAQAKDSAGFDPLEFDRFTRVQELTRMMAESVNDVATVQRNLQRTVEATEDDLIAQARQTRELQRDLLRTRMVEFEGISDRLYRVVRLASKESARQVKLDITGGSIEMDRGVLDRMTPAFEHLLRNCVAHGIEDVAVRQAAGKDAAGTILIDVRQEGNDVSVEFRDDGAGLNLARIREKALQQGLVTPDQQLSDADAANLIFTPGFSTAAQVTELAGRGIGMDVVRSEVNALGGRIETSTQAGRGTSFRLVLPLTTAVTQVVMIRSGNLSIGVPANLIEVVRRAPAREVQQAYNSGVFDFGGEQVPFYWSGALLQSSQRSAEPQAKTLPVVVFRSAAQRVAVHVDEVLGNQEVVVKNLGPQLARLPGLAGMTVLASGAVVLIYNPVALSSVYGERARRLSADHAQPEMLEQAGQPAVPQLAPAAPQIPLVLVVDDSITVRRVTQRLLQREGYRVALAADGLQALERLAEEKPAVVLSDIEMPRMDGFDLARNIRADERWGQLPIVMITSRIAEKHREHARELGVNHYLGKPYSEEELLSLVKHYCTAAVAA